jgi:hypothetical protein
VRWAVRRASGIRPSRSVAATAALLLWVLAGGSALAGNPAPDFTPTLDDWGEYGLMQAPTARTGTDGDFHVFASEVPPYTRFGLDLTALPWLEGQFRYTAIGNRLYGPTSFSGNQSYKDRSFGLKVRLLKEGAWWPETSVGIRDIAGTGLFSSEYLVFSRRFYDFDVTAGVGWGLMSSGLSVPNPLGLISNSFKVRPSANTIGGFTPVYFRGPHIGLFGGIEYHTPIKGLDLKLELDPDDYKNEPLGNNFVVRSPVNAAIDYRPFSFLDLSAGFERGTTVMLRASLHTNFNQPGLPIFDAPPPRTPIRRSAEPVGQPLDESAVPLIADRTAPQDNRLIFEDVSVPSANGTAGDQPRNTDPPRGVPLAETDLPQIGSAATAENRALFDTANRLGATIDAVRIEGDTATLAMSSAWPLLDRERAALRRQALLDLPAIRHVIIHNSVTELSQFDRRLGTPRGGRLAMNTTATVDRLYDGAQNLGYRIDSVAMNGDVATIFVQSETQPGRSSRDRLVHLALANLPGTSRAEIVDAAATTSDMRSAAFGRDIFTELAGIGLKGVSFAIDGNRARLAFTQTRYRDNAKAIGRAVRVVMRHLPPDIEAIRLDLVQNGFTIVSVNLQRADLERAIENAGSPEEVWANAQLTAGDTAFRGFTNAKAYPDFTWSLTPQLEQDLGGPNNFFIYEVYAALSAEATLRRGWTVGGIFGAGLFGNLSQLTLESNSTLPHVRSDLKDYLKDGKYGIYDLQTDYMFDIAPDWYGRVSAGLLEQMFGGIDAEVLYRPHGERWAVGLDVNHVWQRGFHELFGFQGYNVTTAHLSFYYKLPFFHLTAKLSVGQYLAGDRGATLELSRKFDNGIVVGAFATRTNVSAAQFGEGSFDKGIFISIPLDLFFGSPTQAKATYVYRPLTRDGGQMLDIKKPLYDETDGADADTLGEDWPHLLD